MLNVFRDWDNGILGLENQHFRLTRVSPPPCHSGEDHWILELTNGMRFRLIANARPGDGHLRIVAEPDDRSA
jgi:hypothetical protein